ncbi:MAG: YraN family protein [Chloroflexota bacterium]
MTTNYKQNLGQWGENKAAHFLSAKGYKIIARNVRTPHGEIDLIAQRNNLQIFVEVKTRTSKKFGYPEEAITLSKQNHMLEAAQHYLFEEYSEPPDWQIDVIAILGKLNSTSPEIIHFENVRIN